MFRLILHANVIGESADLEKVCNMVFPTNTIIYPSSNIIMVIDVRRSSCILTSNGTEGMYLSQ